jgi:glyoxylase I family protein
MTNVIALNHVSLLVSDTASALDFYQGLLGLDVDESRPETGFPGAWLVVGAAQIHLLEIPAALTPAALPEHGGRDRHFALDVVDLGAVEAALVTAGIPYTFSRSGRRALFCRDPDGNAVELVETSVS